MTLLHDATRAMILGALEEASGSAMPANDPMPDTLIARAQALGLGPLDLRLWIYENWAQCAQMSDWSTASMERWARDKGLLP